MPVQIAEAVNWGDLRDTVLFAGRRIGPTAAFGVVLLGSIRARENYEVRRLPETVLCATVAVVGSAASLTGIVLGLIATSEA